jgi:hypothetical protein
MNVYRGIGSNLKVQLVKKWYSHVKGKGCPLLLFFFFHFSCYIFCFLLSLVFLVFSSTKNTMDECSHKILVVLVFTMAIHQVIAQMVSLQWIAITHNIGVWWMCCYFFQSLWTHHQNFGAYGSMKTKLGHNLLECLKNIVPQNFLCDFLHKIPYNVMLGVF